MCTYSVIFLIKFISRFLPCNYPLLFELQCQLTSLSWFRIWHAEPSSIPCAPGRSLNIAWCVTVEHEWYSRVGYGPNASLFSFTEGELHQGGEEAVKSGHQLARAMPAVATSAAPKDNLNSFILPPYLCKWAHLTQVYVGRKRMRGQIKAYKNNVLRAQNADCLRLHDTRCWSYVFLNSYLSLPFEGVDNHSGFVLL